MMTANGGALALETLTWDEALTQGVDLREQGDTVRWELGDLGNVVAAKWQRNSLKKFASEIGLENHKRLYEYVQVSTYWKSQHRADFPTLSWSHFREAARHSLPLEKALEWMTQASDKNWPVAALREAITGNPNEPITRRKSFEGKITDYYAQKAQVRFDLRTYLEFSDLCELINAGAEVELRVSWQEQR